MSLITQGRIPEGFLIREARMEDVKDLYLLDQKFCRHYFNEEGITLDELQKEWETPGFDLGKSVRVVCDPRGEMVGVVEVWDVDDPPVHPYLWWLVDPDCEEKGIGRWLVAWGTQRARRVLSRVEDGIRVSLRGAVYHEVKYAARVMRELGFELFRHSFRMQVDFLDPPDEPEWPDGITVRVYRPEEDAETVYRVDDEVFQDHFGYMQMPFEEGFKRFMHNMTTGDRYDPGLWYLAVEGEEVVGICLGSKWGHSSKDIGHVSILGVRRSWRRRGIARALLLHCFGEFYRRGYRKVDLGVDAGNLTGALDLYYQVGMKVERQYDKYELELRPGREVSVTELDASLT
ncbi:MAG: GNAT family N-acetyltransferase [Anaerolineales bacterium]|nr:GNAT family N-acetyltransferase [Anaerolineales bacterium]